MATFALAAVGSAASASGDFSATPLSPAGSWTSGGSSGDFSYSMGLRTPAVAAGPRPDLTLSYSAQSVDGRTQSTNSQPSWVGEGWQLAASFIDRPYRTCAQDQAGGNNASIKTGDLCWAGDNLVVSLAGHSGELVRDGSNPDLWRFRSDDGSKVERLTGAANGAHDGEYFRLTTGDGMQYYFGQGARVKGGANPTNSTWTVPVAGNQPGEPGHASSFANSFLTQGWRWNLDHVVDPPGLSMTYYYQAETNKYGQNLAAATVTYTRGGWLDHIDYGQAGSDAPTGKVQFSVAERCLPTSTETCQTLTLSNAAAWPDVPQSQICDAASCTQNAPTFFSRKRLTQVTTSTLVGAGMAEVDRWVFTHQFPAPGEGYAAALWLASVQHTAADGASPDPATTFGGVPLANRVDGITADKWQFGGPQYKWRLASIQAAGGHVIMPTYSEPECTIDMLTGFDGAANTKRCYAQWWSPNTGGEPKLHLWHKYVVTKVEEYDAGNISLEHKVTSHTYTGGAGWAWDDAPTTVDDKRTYSVWAGYPEVTTIVGDPALTTSLKTVETFYRGLDHSGPAGNTRTATVATTEGSPTDQREFRGKVAETRTFAATNATVEATGQVTTYGLAAKVLAASDGKESRRVVVTREDARTTLAAGGQRRTSSSRSYDELGYLTQLDDRGDTGTDTDDRCTQTSYARNDTTWIMAAPAVVRTHAGTCASWVDVPPAGQVISEARTFYDGQPLNQVTAGDVTRNEHATGIIDGAIGYGLVSTATYDPYGRIVSAGDALGNLTTTSYTAPTGMAAPTQVTITGPDPDGPGPLAAHVTASVMDQRWGKPTKVTTPGGLVTQAEYDDHGRLTKVWKPGVATTATPSARHSYTTYTGPGTANAIISTTVGANGVELVTTQIHDGLFRPVQTQTQTLDDWFDTSGVRHYDAGRIVTTKVYDTRGLVVQEHGPVFAKGAPAPAFATISPHEVAHQVFTDYDGLGRVTRSALYSRLQFKWATTTTYGGDRVTVTPPQGGAPSTSVVDARGQQTELLRYPHPTPVGTPVKASYTWTPAGQLASMTDDRGISWSWEYDLLGQQTKAVDPDAGTTTKTYDPVGRLVTSTNANGETLWYGYDALGRKTQLRDTNQAGALRAEWAYDTVRQGQPTSSSRWVAGQKVTTTITGYDDGGRATGTSTVVPAIPGWVPAQLAGTYETGAQWQDHGAIAATMTGPMGPFDTEVLWHDYDRVGRDAGYYGDSDYTIYAHTVSYSALDEVTKFAQGVGSPSQSWTVVGHDEVTRQTSQVALWGYGKSSPTQQVDYSRDPAGQITRIATTGTGLPADNQCFTRDGLGRLVQAWTPASGDCSGAPSVAGLGGPAPYWQSWTFDASDDRLSETTHLGEGDQVRTWSYPATTTAGRPHAATSVTSQSGAAAPATSALSYDAAGNLTGRRVLGGGVTGDTAGDQTLTFDREGRLATAVQGGRTVRFAWGAGNERLLRTDGTTTTLFLGDTELTWDGTKVTGYRSYTFAGRTVAFRTGDSRALTWQAFAEVNDTTTVQTNDATGAVSIQRTLPYGGPRGARPAGFDTTHGFVQGRNDPALGLVHVGAREYDPAAGAFTSPDPLLDTSKPGLWSAYTYGVGNPVNQPDPTGLHVTEGYDLDGEFVDAKSSILNEPKEAFADPDPLQEELPPPTPWWTYYGTLHAGTQQSLQYEMYPAGFMPVLNMAYKKPQEMFVKGSTGYGWVDNAARDRDGVLHIWEVKHDSPAGIAAGSRQIRQYLAWLLESGEKEVILGSGPQATLGAWNFQTTTGVRLEVQERGGGIVTYREVPSGKRESHTAPAVETQLGQVGVGIGVGLGVAAGVAGVRALAGGTGGKEVCACAGGLR